MIKKFLLIFLFFFLFTSKSFCTNIATIDIELILNESDDYKKFLSVLDNYKSDKEKKLRSDENLLLKKQKEIEEQKIILNEEQITKALNEYNDYLFIFKEEVDTFNKFINDNLNYNKSIIIQNIYDISKKLSISNEIDIILEKENYFLIKDYIDISNIIIKELNNMSIDLKIVEN